MDGEISMTRQFEGVYKGGGSASSSTSGIFRRLESVRQELATIPGSMSDDMIADREEGFDH